ncbi:MAG: CsgG/HfaB family protein [Chitinispirillales bacterium]|jgi:hypothetical protein|nr:CsgG/HfaB family protein [Chitinispirillales bacterium]
MKVKRKNLLLTIFVAITFSTCGMQLQTSGLSAQAPTTPPTQAQTRTAPAAPVAQSQLNDVPPTQAQARTAPQPIQTAAIETGLADLDLAVREASNYLNDNLAVGSKLMILYIQSDYQALSEYIIDELVANTVNDRKLSMVDRRQIDAIRAELNFQMSGAVDDESAQRVGRMLGAQTIISGAVTKIGEIYRLRIRAIDVETARVKGQFNRNIPDGPAIAMLARSSATSSGAAIQTSSAPVRATPTQSGATPIAQSTARVTTPSIQGTNVPGANFTEKLAWLRNNAESHATYILEANANETIAPQTLEYDDLINVTIVLRGDHTNRTVRLQSHGSMFTVRSSTTLILNNNITLHGHSGNNALVMVRGGTFRMNAGSTITGNLRSTTENTNGGGVHVDSAGVFEMNDGIIFANTARFGGGVYVGPRGSFTMKGGSITGNNANNGGGVSIRGRGFDNSHTTFTMTGGIISDNIASEIGGGVFVHHEVANRSQTTFTMLNGTISSNTANSGGGVGVDNGSSNFFMRGGTITGNIAHGNGGGVFRGGNGSFIKNGGIITSYNTNTNNGNAVRDGNGNVQANRGHAVFVRGNYRKEATVGTRMNLFIEAGHIPSGNWDR